MAKSLSITEVLARAKPGDPGSMEALLPLVYEQLRLLASRQLSKQPGHTLQPTALVHEAFMKMVGGDQNWSGRDHFMAVASKAMRSVLVDHSRRKSAEKRGGKMDRSDVSMDDLAANGSSREVRVLELDELLNELSRSGERAARVAEMRLFGGMEMEQIARVLELSRMTVQRDWEIARAWLAGRISEVGHGQ